MIARRSILGLCLLCAFAFSAFAAQGASAASNGTTAFTCVKEGGAKDFKDAHCKERVTAGSGSFGHVGILENTVTKVTSSNETTSGFTESFFLHSTQLGIETEFKATAVTGTGSMENMKDAVDGQHTANGIGIATFAGVTLTKPEEEVGKCKVYGEKGKKSEGTIKTNELKATTAGQGDKLKFEPTVAGKAIATFFVEGCTKAALNGEYVVKGNIVSDFPNGSTIGFHREQTTVQFSLTLRGQFAGLAGTVTFKGENGNPLTATTVATP